MGLSDLGSPDEVRFSPTTTEQFSNDIRQKSFFPPQALQLTLKTKQKLPFSNLAQFIFHCGIDVCPVNLEEVSDT